MNTYWGIPKRKLTSIPRKGSAFLEMQMLVNNKKHLEKQLTAVERRKKDIRKKLVYIDREMKRIKTFAVVGEN